MVVSQKRLVKLKAEIQNKYAEEQALREYRYTALKSLYEKCEPILFQFLWLSESALIGIMELAQNAKKGNAEDTPAVNHFTKLTLYRLLTPLGAFKILQNQLTLVDFALEESKLFQYSVAKVIYYSFSDHFEKAKSEPIHPL